MDTGTRRSPPSFCQYADGACDQQFLGTLPSTALFLYPSAPEQIANSIESAVTLLRHRRPTDRWISWRHLANEGQIIFCEICKAARFATHLAADVTTLNFNLMFEIGFALGLEQPLALLRDRSFTRDLHLFRDLSLLETIGYVDFENSEELAGALLSALPARAIPPPPVALNRAAPLYVVKSHVSTDGQLRLLSTLSGTALSKYRSYDPREDPPLSLHEARKQVAQSFGVIAHLIHRDRAGSTVHNARCALIAGIGTASGKIVVLLQEGEVAQPIDYRDIVIPYSQHAQIEDKLRQPILRILNETLDPTVIAVRPPTGVLERLDLGDIAAENETRQLPGYFVQTGQYNDARRGHARLVVGRKGSGKTAIFYSVRDSLPRTHSYLVLDMKPEGHQFLKLREAILDHLSPGLKEHTLTAFWTYILLCEIAQKIIDTDESWAERDADRYRRFQELRELYRVEMPDDSGDLSERLLRQVDKLTSRLMAEPDRPMAQQATQLLFKEEIPRLQRAVGEYLVEKSEVWLLVDNLDKGWPTKGTSAEDVLVLRTLLGASAKLQHYADKQQLSFFCLVFIRNDIYDLLLRETSDRDKDTAINLDWSDPEVFKELIRRRIVATTELKGTFAEVWPALFAQHVGTQESFRYVVDRTLMRPRDLLRFIRRVVEVAVNRGHGTVESDDFLAAEASYSEEMLQSINFEIKDAAPDCDDLVYYFIGTPWRMAVTDVRRKLSEKERVEDALQILLWFGFLGIETVDGAVQFAYDVRYNVGKLLALVSGGQASLVVHPAFRTALGSEAPA